MMKHTLCSHSRLHMGAWARHSWGIFKWSKPDELRRKKAHKRRAFNHHYFIIFIKHRILNSSCPYCFLLLPPRSVPPRSLCAPRRQTRQRCRRCRGCATPHAESVPRTCSSTANGPTGIDIGECVAVTGAFDGRCIAAAAAADHVSR